MNDITSTPTPFSAGKLVFGLILFAIGVLAFLDAIDLYEARELWRYWPVLLIVLGVSKEIDAIRARKGDNGVVLIAIGVWMLAATQEFLGLSYATAFPIGVAVAGLGIILHALIDIDGNCTKGKEQQS